MATDQYATTAELIQLGSALVGIGVSGYALASALLDIMATVSLRRNGINGFVGLVRLRREIFQFMCHGAMAISGMFVVMVRATNDPLPTTPAGMSLLYTRNAVLTIIALLLISNTLFDRAERRTYVRMDGEQNRRASDKVEGKQ